MHTAIQYWEDICPVHQQPVQTLLIDNDIFDRIRLRRYMAKLDMLLNLTEVSTIEEVAVMLKARRFDLVLIDYVLPEGSGLDVLDMVRSDPRNATAATVMISGAMQTSVAHTALRRGCHDYIAKDQLSVRLMRDVLMGALDAARQTPRLRLCPTPRNTTH